MAPFHTKHLWKVSAADRPRADDSIAALFHPHLSYNLSSPVFDYHKPPHPVLITPSCITWQGQT